MKRIVAIQLVGVGLGTVACFFLWWTPARPTALDRNAYTEYSARTAREDGWAPVQFEGEAPADVTGDRSAQKAARFVLSHGEVLAGEAHVPIARVRQFLDDRVSKGEIDHVVVLLTKGTKWGEVFPVLDECRKSRVRIVLLNQYEL